MSHRPPTSIVGLMVLGAVVSVAAGCPNDPAKSPCTIDSHEVTVAHQTVAPAMSLMLLSDARLDTVGDRFVLTGNDGGTVRWAVFDRDGNLVGDEQAVQVPVRASGVWSAAAGTSTPGDRMVIAFVAADAPTVGDVDLQTLSVQIDGTAPTTPVSSGRIPAGAKVTMMSGRGGMHAGIAWGQQGQTVISTRIVGGNGLPVAAAPDLNLGTVGDFSCLRFSPGKADLTLGYVDLSGLTPSPIFVGTEIDANGSVGSPFRLNIGAQPLQPPGCVEVVPAAEKYGIAWHSAGIAIYFSVFDPKSPSFTSNKVLWDDQVPAPGPTLGGLGWLGKNYAVVFARPTGAEVWPVDATGRRQGVLPVLPSHVGHTGSLSTQQIGSTLYGTYADYSDAVGVSAGSRIWVKVTCP